MFVITYNGVPYSVTPLSLKPCSSVYAAVWSTVTGRALVGVDTNGFNAVRDQVAAHIVDTGTNLKGQGL
jgi:hypothetical protein